MVWVRDSAACFILITFADNHTEIIPWEKNRERNPVSPLLWNDKSFSVTAHVCGLEEVRACLIESQKG